MSLCMTRLRKEYKELQKKPLENIRAAPKETNILEWHYVIQGPNGSSYENGWYHGIIMFPSEYPYKPPSIQMFTPNGRFKPSTRLCLSMSDFHPESWNPMWSVGTILMGLYSFMLEDSPTFGSIVTSDTFKRKVAKESLSFNIKNKTFCEIFPELVDFYEDEMKKNHNNKQVNNNINNNIITTSSDINKNQDNATSWIAVLGVFAAIIACTWAILSLAL